MKLSILDLATIYNDETPSQSLQNSTELVKLADRLGYTRYWFAEHHNATFQMSTSPDLLSAHAAALTKNIRIGSGGIMIPNHSPLKVVENFSILEALHPGRIDLGMGRASGTDGITNAALRNNHEPLTGEAMMNQLMEIFAFFNREFPEGHPYQNINASPDPSLRPEIFMLGSSDGGMQIASQLGVGFAFAGQINPDWAVSMLKKYRENFNASQYLAQPYSMLSIIVICADTDEEAGDIAGPAELQWARWMTGQYKYGPPTLEEARAHKYTKEETLAREQNKNKFIIGSAESVKKQLEQIAKEAEVDEIMVANMITDKEARHKSYSLLAEAFNLSASAESI
ncbi:LLM class flavin-dependent oxidoreductase [Virgibacillus sp. W0181]|uniref:LLM class flavin-dependent oxidoreductase n=1 Tax=Virgibacillus sp. W0181 TaxID=3391581 RepID=UPI003F4623E3